MQPLIGRGVAVLAARQSQLASSPLHRFLHSTPANVRWGNSEIRRSESVTPTDHEEWRIGHRTHSTSSIEGRSALEVFCSFDAPLTMAFVRCGSRVFCLRGFVSARTKPSVTRTEMTLSEADRTRHPTSQKTARLPASRRCSRGVRPPTPASSCPAPNQARRDDRHAMRLTSVAQ